jgi:hypothetical protein
MAIASSGRFLVGNVFASAFEIYRRHFWSFSFLTLISFIFLLLIVVLAVLGLLMPSILDAGGFDDPMDDFAAASSGQLAAMFLVGIVVAILCLAALQWAAAGICYGSAQDMRGQYASFGACLARAFSVLIPVVGATILFILLLAVIGGVLALIIGLIFSLISPWLGLLAVIPLIYIYVRLWVVVPVIVVERPGIVASFSRSLQLTRGEALRIFGIALVLVAISLAVSKFLEVFGESTLAAIVDLAVQIIITAFTAVVVAVGYVELRKAKEGFGVEDLAAVFD